MGSLIVLALAVMACGSPVEPGAAAWRRVPEPGPAPRWGHAAVLDGDRVLVFGGASASGELADVWSFALATEAWTQLADAGPPPRINPGAVLDPLRDRLVIFGGRTGLTGTLGDAWAFSLATGEWTELPAGPPPRQRPHAASDGARAWFYAGEGTLARVFSDLWELDLATDSWRQLPSELAGRTCGAFAYTGGALVVTGGHGVASAVDDTWRYDLAAARWTQLATHGSTAAAAHRAYDFDPATGRLWLAGGDHLDNYNTALTDVLALDAQQFSLVATSNLPPVHDHATLVFDPARQQLVLFGGSVGDGQSFSGDTWILPVSP